MLALFGIGVLDVLIFQVTSLAQTALGKDIESRLDLDAFAIGALFQLGGYLLQVGLEFGQEFILILLDSLVVGRGELRWVARLVIDLLGIDDSILVNPCLIVNLQLFDSGKAYIRCVSTSGRQMSYMANVVVPKDED